MAGNPRKLAGSYRLERARAAPRRRLERIRRIRGEKERELDRKMKQAETKCDELVAFARKIQERYGARPRKNRRMPGIGERKLLKHAKDTLRLLDQVLTLDMELNPDEYATSEKRLVINHGKPGINSLRMVMIGELNLLARKGIITRNWKSRAGIGKKNP